MKFAVVAASVLPLLSLTSALVIPNNPEAIEAFGKELGSKLEHEIENVAHKFGLEKDMAPIVTSEIASQNIIEDSYIIIFKNDVDADKAALHHLWVQELHDKSISILQKRDGQHPLLSKSDTAGLKHVFNIGDSVKGYSGRFHSSVIEAIRNHDSVAFVEHDSRVFSTSSDLENDAPWGLARISHRDKLTLGSFNKYLFDDEGGEGVTAYVIDTGTNIEHVDFEGRASWGKTIPEGDEDVDGNGHGTHCSGTIAGKKYGVAKKANIVAVKVLRSNGSGSMSDVIKGVEYAAESHIKAAKAGKKGFKGSTANMSLGGGKSPSLDLAVNAAVKAGIHFAVAAGNDNADACNYSPASADLAVTVGASALSDVRAYFSNYGKCVDIFGPGVNIPSTYIGSKYAVATLSGTSMASPHLAGLLSYYLSLQPAADSEYALSGSITPAQLKKNVISFATSGILTDIPDDTPNVLAFNGAGKNITEFWFGEDAKTEESKEHEFKILPTEESLVEELKSAVNQVEGLFGEIKEAMGL